MCTKAENDAGIIALPIFQDLLRRKRRFLVSLVSFFFTFYFALPVLVVYSNILEQQAFRRVSWAWVYALAQFCMTWVVSTVYCRKAREFDAVVHQLKADT